MGSVGKTGYTTVDTQRFSTDLDSYIGGGYSVSDAFDENEIRYIRNNMQETSKPLYRVEDESWTAKGLKVGDTVNFNDTLKSFAQTTSAVGQILKDGEEWDTYETPVVFQTTGSQKHFDVKSAARQIGNSTFDYQDESFVKGKGWKVKKIGTKTIAGRKVKVITIG